MSTHTNLTTNEAAEYLRVSARTMIRWRNERIGPPWTKIGHRVVYRRSDLEQWLSANRIHPVMEQFV